MRSRNSGRIIGRSQVDAAAEESLELVLDPGKTEVADGVVELGDEVDVAVRLALVARDGAEDEERADTEPAKVVPVGGEERDGIGTAHGRIVSPGARERKQGGRRARGRDLRDPGSVFRGWFLRGLKAALSNPRVVHHLAEAAGPGDDVVVVVQPFSSSQNVPGTVPFTFSGERPRSSRTA